LAQSGAQMKRGRLIEVASLSCGTAISNLLLVQTIEGHLPRIVSMDASNNLELWFLLHKKNFTDLNQ
jgi:hypothetical protein